MILDVIRADYAGDYKISIRFNNGEDVTVDLEEYLRNEHRKIFEPLRDIDFFKSFNIKLNTVTWSNHADFAPEFLLELGHKQDRNKQ